MSTSLSEDCAVCGKSFKRLGAHLLRSLACGSYYMPRRADTDECRESEGADHGTRPNLRSSSYSTLFRAQRATVRGEADDEPPIINVNGVDDEDFFVMDDDDGFPNDNVDEEDVPSDASEGEEGPGALAQSRASMPTLDGYHKAMWYQNKTAAHSCHHQRCTMANSVPIQS